MVKFTLDNHEVEVEPGTTILKAAREISIDIPTFCYQDRLSILASCRMCLVEVEDRRKLEPACATVISEGMVVHSRSEKVVSAREDMLEILLANHPLDCPVCDKGGECELQDTVFEYGKGDSRLQDNKRVFRERDIELNQVIIFNANRCIQCQRCVRVCEEVVGEVALGTAERGLDSEITGVGNSLKDCSHCGNCIEVCPVGALMSTPYRYKARPWDMVQTETICTLCGTGCSLTIEARNGELKRVKSKYETGINGELLCAKGRFGFDMIDGGERIDTPMIRKGDILSPVSWQEAIEFIANMARSITNSGGQIHGLISPRQTNETAFGFHTLMQTVFNSSTLHASCRFGGAETLKALTQVMTQRYSRAPLQEVLQAECILLLGSNITEENPVSGYLIREVMRDQGNKLLIASSRPCGLDDIAHACLRLLPGNEAHLLSDLTTDEPLCGDPDSVDFVAHAKPMIAAAKRVTLLVGTEFLRTAKAESCLLWINKAAALLEKAGRKVTVQFLFDRPNQLGVWDMGCLPAEETIPVVPDMLYVLGSDPVSHCAEKDPHGQAALKTACLVVQDSHMSRSAERAMVVLPAPSYGEETGTYTNNEGRVQKLQVVRSPAVDIMPVAEVFSRIATAMGIDFGPYRPEQLYARIRNTHRQYQNLAQWSDAQDLGLTISIAAGDMPAPDPLADVKPRGVSEQGYRLITGDSLFHSGLLSQRSETLSSLDGGPYVEMNPGEGYEGEMAGYDVTVQRNGEAIILPLKGNRAFPEGLIYMPENYLMAGTRALLSGTDYPMTVEVHIHPAKQG